MYYLQRLGERASLPEVSKLMIFSPGSVTQTSTTEAQANLKNSELRITYGAQPVRCKSLR